MQALEQILPIDHSEFSVNPVALRVACGLYCVLEYEEPSGGLATLYGKLAEALKPYADFPEIKSTEFVPRMTLATMLQGSRPDQSQLSLSIYALKSFSFSVSDHGCRVVLYLGRKKRAQENRAQFPMLTPTPS